MTIKVKDRGWNEIKKALKKGGKYAAVGVQGKNASKSREGMTMLHLALIHEFGSSDGNVPERSFIRAGVEEKRKAYEKEYIRIAEEFFEDPKRFEGELMLLGERARKDIIDRVKKGLSPELEESTKKRRRGNDPTPLIDTGMLILQSISAVIRKKKESK